MPETWAVVDRTSVRVVLSESTPSVAHHLLATVLMNGCGPDCRALVSVEPREPFVADTESSSFRVVPDDPSRDPVEVWGCPVGTSTDVCLTDAGYWEHFRVDECVETPCVMGHTMELESEVPIDLTLDISLMVTGHGERPPPGILAALELD